MFRWKALILSLLASMILGCSERPSAENVSLMRDSAGISIVDSQLPAWPDLKGWQLSPEPVVTIGVVEGAEEYRFHEIMGAVRLDDGSIVVVEQGSKQLRLYDRMGRHLWSAGGSGGGPGEFRQVAGLFRMGADTLAVADGMRPIHLFSSDGHFLYTVEWPQEHGLFAQPIGVLRDHTILYAVAVASGVAAELTEPTQNLVPIVRLEPSTGDADTVAVLPALIMYPVGGSQTTEIFGPRLSIAAGVDEFYAGYSDQFAIRKFDPDGRLTSIVRRAWKPVSPSANMLEQYRAHHLGLAEGAERIPDRNRELVRQVLEATPVSQFLPAFTAILTDPDGNLWVRETDPEHLFPVGSPKPVYSVPSRWSIFDPDGYWLGTVSTPARFHVSEIGRDYVIGIGRDELGVESVLVYELQKQP